MNIELAPRGPITTADDVVLVDAHADHHIRSDPDDRLHHIFEERCDALRARGMADHLAVDQGALALSYDELDRWANRLAHHLTGRGVHPGDRVALLCDRSAVAYAAMLAVSKLHATFVPLDAAFPEDRMAYIVEDAEVTLVVTVEQLAAHLDHLAVPIVSVDGERDAIEAQPSVRPAVPPTGDDALCYIIYTSGSTGRPKGVAMEHRSVANFVRVAAECYGYVESDRVYQGMTIAFDFSVEEIWVPFAVGATLVPNSTGASLVGSDLADFLAARRVSALCCVPTLLATVAGDLPDLRFLLVSGEACPQDLVDRWYRPDRVFLNVYGPTEAAVTATWTHLHPDVEVTIGLPLPTYSVVILDPDAPVARPRGAEGELGIAGVCLARGYVNRDDLTERAFVDDFVGMPENPSGRIYRTGDLARIDERGEIVYLGRIDTQVKIRGYRVELAEIESVLSRVPGVAQAVVTTHEATPGTTELVAFYTCRDDAEPPSSDGLAAAARDRLPPYMVPTYFEALDRLPMLASDKVDRKNLPAPSAPRWVAAGGPHVAAATPTESLCAEVLAAVLGADEVSVEAHFFDELGANSLVMARFAALVRERDSDVDIAMKDLYLAPTIRSLGAALDVRTRRMPVTRSTEQRPAHVATRLAHLATGVAQAGCYFALLYLVGVLGVWAHGVLGASRGPVDAYLRAVVVGVFAFAVGTALPIAAKWLLIGRWREGEIPIWGARYLRFWLVKTLTRASPMLAFTGSPLYNHYLRALGMRVGAGAVVLTHRIPLCSDLVTIGPRAVIRDGAQLPGHVAHGGRIHTGPVDVGADAYVGTAAFCDIGTSIGDRAQLAHASSLQAGQHVPPGGRAWGSPAEVTATSYQRLPGGDPPPSRRRILLYSTFQLLNVFGFAIPLAIAFLALAFWIEAHRVWVAGLLYLGLLVAGLVTSVAVPRLLSLLLVADRTYPLYGFHYAASRTLNRTANSRFYNQLLGDSSYILGYLGRVGVRLRGARQTGSNFGLEQRWEAPALSQVGSGTLVSDGLSVVNSEVSSTSFRLAPVAMGADSFLGNRIVIPAGARLGDDVLIGTKTMVPVDGPVRTHVGLLGSPAFEIPRSVLRDAELAHPTEGPAFAAALAAKNRSNLLSMVLFVVTQFGYLYLLMSVVSFGVLLHPEYDAIGFAGGALAAMATGVVYYSLVERASLRFGRLQPRSVSIYDPYYWHHERYWKLNDVTRLRLFDGTPFKPVAWRLLGVRIGRMTYDGGASMTERTLVEIGDHCTLSEGAVLQAHSLEDGVFKSDHIRLGDRVTVAPGAFVHYGTVVGDDATIGPDAFLMKGEEVSAGATWCGNPARPDHRRSESTGAVPFTARGVRAVLCGLALLTAVAAVTAAGAVDRGTAEVATVTFAPRSSTPVPTASIAPVVAAVRALPHAEIVVVGSSAPGETPDPASLALLRARRVAAALEAAGVAQGRITVQGVTAPGVAPVVTLRVRTSGQGDGGSPPPDAGGAATAPR